MMASVNGVVSHCRVYCMQGMCVAFIGPCLRHFQRQTTSSLAQISGLFVGHAAGSVVGLVVSLYGVGGCGASVVAVSLLSLAASVAVVPWCTSLVLLVALFVLQGCTSAITAASESSSLASVSYTHLTLPTILRV